MEKVKISALILDYGGVISEPQNAENVNNICERLKLNTNDFIEIYRNKRPAYDRGEISGHDYWMGILDHYGMGSDTIQIDRLIREDVKSWTKINAAMLQFIKNSRNKIDKLAIVSNMTRETLKYMKRNFEWLTLFDTLVFSCDIGKNKPEKEIYETCLKKLILAPGQCLFVDDSPENVQGALKTGMNTLQFTTFPVFLRALDDKYRLAHLS